MYLYDRMNSKNLNITSNNQKTGVNIVTLYNSNVGLPIFASMLEKVQSSS